VDLVEHLDDLIDDKVRFSIIILYYTFSLPYIFVLTLPVAMLLTTMFSMGRLVSDNEITAIKASGISLYRILLPLYVFSLFVCVIILLVTEFVVPHTNRYRGDIEMQGNNFRFSLSRDREMDRAHIFLANRDGSIVYARTYNSTKKIARNVFIIKPGTYQSTEDSSRHRQYLGITKRIDAETMTFKDRLWTLHNVEVRVFTHDGEKLEIFTDMPGDFLSVEPSDFARINIKPEEMNYLELRNYISKIKEKGGDASDWIVDLYLKISFPLVSFVIVFFGAPMVAGSTKRSKAASFGIALVICFVYYSLINACQILGRNGTIEPVVAAWSPNGLFLIIGLFMHASASK
jgi:lipopolysaccharide export system permease protein